MAARALAVIVALAAGPASLRAQPPAALPLAEALARARALSPVVAAASARVEAARLAGSRAGRFLNPLVEVRSENWASGAPGGMPLDVFATVTQTVELGGERRARRAGADAGLAVAAAAEAVAARDIARAVVTDYLAALRAREHAAARAEFAAQMAEATRVMQRRVEAGTAPEADLLKLRTEEARAVVERARAELALARSLATLGATLAADVLPTALQETPVPPLPASDASVATSHPELRAAVAAIAAARAAAELEHARAVPDLAVNAGYKRTARYDTGVAAITVPIPLFDRNGVARALADGHLQAAERDRDAVVARLRGTFAATHRAAALLSDRAGSIQGTLVDPARGARDAARAAFGAGALDVLRLVDAERLYADAAVAAIDLRIDAVAATIDARLAAGHEPLP